MFLLKILCNLWPTGKCESTRFTAVARTLIGGGGVYSYIHVLPTSFFWNQIQIYQFEKKLVGQNMNIWIKTPRINVLATALTRLTKLRACNVPLDVLTEWGVEPNDVALSVPALFMHASLVACIQACGWSCYVLVCFDMLALHRWILVCRMTVLKYAFW